jgi:hypothetical protein
MNPKSAQQPDPLVELRDDLAKIIKDRIDGEAAREKERQYLRLDKADNYYRGNPYIAAEYDAASGTMGWSSVGTPRIGTSEESSELYDYNIDVTKSYGRKFFSVLGTRPFHNAKSLPDNPESEEDRKAARQQELAAIFLKDKWNVRVRNIEVFYHQWKAGNVFAFIDHVADKKLWGETTEPVMDTEEQEVEPAGYRCTSCGEKSPEPQTLPVNDPVTGMPVEQAVCPNCGAAISDINFEDAQTAQVPIQVGEKKYANAGPRLELCTGYTVTYPLDAKTIESLPWLLYEYEEHPGALLQLYREQLKDKLDENGEIKNENSDGIIHEQGRRYRHSSASIGGIQNSEERKARWTYSRYWLAPFEYEYFKDEQKRKLAYAQFPDGMRVSRVEGITVKIENEAITDSWAVFEPEPGDYLYKDPMCWGILGHQDVINDGWNMMIAILERVMPSGFYDPDVIDGNMIQERGHICEYLPAKPGAGARLEQAFVKGPTASFPDDAMPMMGLLEQNIQSHTGLQPAVYGGGEKAQTAEEARTRLNQALMQLGVPGEYAGLGWKNVLDIAIRKIKKYGLKAGVVAANGSAELFDIEALRGGNAHFQNEPGVPMSWAERRDQMNLLIGQNPALASAMGLDNPVNISVLRDFLLPGMEELQIPNEDRRQSVVETIRDLLQQQPVDDQPTILPEPMVDDPMDAQLVLDWLRSDAGRKAKKENPMGRQNVVNYGMALSMLPPPIGAPPPMPPVDEKGKPLPMGPPPGGPGGGSPALPPA